MLYDLQVLIWQNGALAAGAQPSEIASYLGGGYGDPNQAAPVAAPDADTCCGCIML
jgi:hypothetical protein